MTNFRGPLFFREPAHENDRSFFVGFKTDEKWSIFRGLGQWSTKNRHFREPETGRRKSSTIGRHFAPAPAPAAQNPNASPLRRPPPSRRPDPRRRQPPSRRPRPSASPASPAPAYRRPPPRIGRQLSRSQLGFLDRAPRRRLRDRALRRRLGHRPDRHGPGQVHLLPQRPGRLEPDARTPGPRSRRRACPGPSGAFCTRRRRGRGSLAARAPQASPPPRRGHHGGAPAPRPCAPVHLLPQNFAAAALNSSPPENIAAEPSKIVAGAQDAKSVSLIQIHHGFKASAATAVICESVTSAAQDSDPQHRSDSTPATDLLQHWYLQEDRGHHGGESASPAVQNPDSPVQCFKFSLLSGGCWC